MSETNLGAHYTGEEQAFLKAVTTYRSQHHKLFLTACDYLQVLKQLGYQKVCS